jgi:hypothetical protein
MHDTEALLQFHPADCPEALCLSMQRDFNRDFSDLLIRLGYCQLMDEAYLYLCRCGDDTVYDAEEDFTWMIEGCEWLYTLGARNRDLLLEATTSGNILLVRWILTRPDMIHRLNEAREIARLNGFKKISLLLL